MDISNLNPFIRYAVAHKDIRINNVLPSICYDCRLFYFDNVTGTITANKKYTVENKTAVFLPPESEYFFDINFTKNSSLIIFNFDLTNINCHITHSLSTATKSTYNKEITPPYEHIEHLNSPIVKRIPEIETFLVQCVDNFILKNEFYQESSSALLKLAILELVKTSSNITYSEICEKVLNYIQENFQNASLTNSDIAKKFNYHPYYLGEIIKKETGKTLHQFLIYYRLNMAKSLLKTTQFSINEITWRCGFNSPSHLAKSFINQFGMTPREYRQINKNLIF